MLKFEAIYMYVNNVNNKYIKLKIYPYMYMHTLYKHIYTRICTYTCVCVDFVDD